MLLILVDELELHALAHKQPFDLKAPGRSECLEARLCLEHREELAGWCLPIKHYPKEQTFYRLGKQST